MKKLSRSQCAVGPFLAAALAMAILPASPADAQLRDMLRSATDRLTEDRSEPQQQVQQAFTPGRQDLSVQGYSESFADVRRIMESGDYLGAKEAYTDRRGSFSRQFLSANDEFLSNVEQGIMLLDGQSPAGAIDAFDAAEQNVEEARDGERGDSVWSRVQRTTGRGLGALARVAGVRGLGPYSEQDYERVLQLNYLTLSYLVQGDNRAFNVMRRATTEQAVARDLFAAQIADADSRRVEAGAPRDPSAQSGFFGQFDAYSHIATRVPDAYVNPLGDYLTGVIFEIDAVENPNTLTNANTAYSNALSLRSDSSVLRSAIQATSGPRAQDGQTVHILMAEGFSPARQLLVYGLQYADIDTLLEYPMLVPIPSRIDRFEAYAPNGAFLGRFDPIGDIEAIMMRSQQDRLPLAWAELIAGAWRTHAQRQAAGDNQWIRLGVGVVEGMQMPDMRSWSSLPRRFHVARLRPAAGTQEIEVRALDEAGNVLFTERARIDPQSRQAVVYGRATNAALSLSTPDQLWIDR
tara:strand:- start:2963 stop:4525 length:1563 start_codon:yes stop_codon:yes gene_type:complete